MGTTEHWFKSEGRLLRLTNLDKLLYPESGFTKREVLKYYQRIAPAILPHLKNRAITLKRYPNGVEELPFFEKRCPSHAPSWFHRISRDEIDYCAIDSLPALLWCANLGAIELHPFLSGEPDQGHAGEMVFDLDPGAGMNIADCARVALVLARDLERYGLLAFPKASGSKGMQVYVPLHSGVTFDETKSFSRQIAQAIERKHPNQVTSNMALRERPGKIYIDWAQNDAAKTTVAVYSLRGTLVPSVSFPLVWEEVKSLASARAPSPIFPPERAVRRFQEEGDLFASVLTMVQKLPRPLARFQRVYGAGAA